MPNLSKSKLIAYRQCPKRLWLEVHQPELREDSAKAQASFKVGHKVGDLARHLYDPKGRGSFLDIKEIGLGGLITQTQQLLQSRGAIFEAGFSVGPKGRGALAIADVLLPHSDGRSWRMIEVKSSTEVKGYHHDDAAIQYHVATQAGVAIKSLKIAHIDSAWVYPGGDDYQGLLKEEDLTDIAASQDGEVRRWLKDAHQIVAANSPPQQALGAHCKKPFGCGFEHVCQQEDDDRHGVAEYPISWLPMQATRKVFKQFVEANPPPRTMVDIPDEVLNVRQLRVKRAHLGSNTFFDAAEAAQRLAAHRLPALFLDFETVDHAVPSWAGTRAYQQIPFQFSLHRLSRTGKLTHCGVLDLSGSDPSLRIAKALVATCGTNEPIYAYSMSFEGGRLLELARRFPKLADGLQSIERRLVDLRPVAEGCYYHPDQHGSWSIKNVLPTIAPELRYDQLGVVKDGGAAMEAYREAVALETLPERRRKIYQDLWRYCRLDTFAMVRLWAFFSGRTDFVSATDECDSVEVEV